MIERPDNQPVLLSGDIDKLSAESIAEQLRSACESIGLQVVVDNLSMTQPEKVVRVMENGVEVLSLYPTGVHGSTNLKIMLPEKKPAIPLILKGVFEQIIAPKPQQIPETRSSLRSWFRG